ncbi:LysM peptidoglycan-binding domain-containing protein [Dysgonomonas sp. 520]|uniref:amino acid ABC transporter substrate-binding protein n=1 Tax=Dysgonomonas sp. 520 TaxID=2302931 RepID=UPI0013D49E97|nr:LysM peptidoglycan-binding domain-containing protein [Dysgonomonas sp. 520]
MKSRFKTTILILSICFAIPFMTVACKAGVSVANASTLANDNKYVVHKVAQGETSYSIAKKYDVDLKDLYKLNPSAEQSIHLGQELVIPVIKKVEYKSHKPKKSETVYSISKEYDTTVEEILNLNPKLGTDGLKEGKSIKVPVVSYQKVKNPAKPSTTTAGASKATTHRVKPKETLYSLSKEYNVTIDELVAANPQLSEGLKTDMIINIPQAGNNTTATEIAQAITKEKTNNKKESVIKLGVMLSFLDKSGNPNQRYVEYYEGMLLAIDELKKKGHSLEVYTFDLGAEDNTKKLKDLLSTSDIADLHIIIGGSSNEQIGLLANYANEKDLKYIIPFPAKSDALALNSNVYQVSTSHSILYPKIVDLFVDTYSSDNIILINDKSNNEKSDLLNLLKAKCKQKNIAVKEVQTGTNFDTSVRQALSNSKRNILIPSSSSYSMLTRALAVAKAANLQDAMYDISLFGYPDWQAYKQLYADMQRFNTSIYSSFFVPNNDKTKQFDSKYMNAYGKEMMNTFPKYAMLGYDTGIFFVTAISRYGKDFEDNVNKMWFIPIQTAFHFVKNKNNGYMNDGLYIVNFNSLGVERTDKSK